MHHHIRPQARDRGATAGSLRGPVFIAGAGCSGTTLMRSLLSAHSRICVSPETHFMARAEKRGFRERDAPLDIDPDGFRTFDPARPLEVSELTLVETDRFRPELQRVQAASPHGDPGRKVYGSRAKAGRRKLVNEEEEWPRLREAGFERVAMEDLSAAPGPVSASAPQPYLDARLP